ncbi:MAG: hypothetical protein P4L82_09885 [Ancalomicrobiaceae bacterium]|nr:hypothetical protein [Ancalomicrobiaceae bacterium]
MSAVILPFDRSKRRSERGAVPGGKAEILLFTGIRYEHADRAIAVDASAGSRRTERSNRRRRCHSPPHLKDRT